MKKFAIGCGITALVLIGLGILLTVLVGQWLGKQMGDLERVEEFTSAMIDEYGQPGEFVPPIDGVYDPDRIALFVEIREDVHERGLSLASAWNDLVDPAREKKGGLGGLIEGSRQSLRLVRESLFHMGAADSILVARGMGRGEYLHYDILALFAVMNVDLEDLLLPVEALDPDSNAREVVEELAEEADKEARRWLEDQAGNARRESERDPALANWTAYLNEQLARAAEDRHYVPMTDPLPESLASLFAPYEVRLLSTRPTTIGDWMAEMPLIVEVEQDSDGSGFNFRFN